MLVATLMFCATSSVSKKPGNFNNITILISLQKITFCATKYCTHSNNVKKLTFKDPSEKLSFFCVIVKFKNSNLNPVSLLLGTYPGTRMETACQQPKQK